MTLLLATVRNQSWTGFKWIAKMIKDAPELNCIGGGEESFGYMVGDFARDSDGNLCTPSS